MKNIFIIPVILLVTGCQLKYQLNAEGKDPKFLCAKVSGLFYESTYLSAKGDYQKINVAKESTASKLREDDDGLKFLAAADLLDEIEEKREKVQSDLNDNLLELLILTGENKKEMQKHREVHIGGKFYGLSGDNSRERFRKSQEFFGATNNKLAGFCKAYGVELWNFHEEYMPAYSAYMEYLRNRKP